MSEQIVRMRCGKTHPKLFKLPDGYRVDWQGLAPWVLSVADGTGLRCVQEDCNRQLRAFVVQGRYSDKIECGPRCQSATGPSCECRCRGENHGAN